MCFGVIWRNGRKTVGIGAKIGAKCGINREVCRLGCLWRLCVLRNICMAWVALGRGCLGFWKTGGRENGERQEVTGGKGDGRSCPEVSGGRGGGDGRRPKGDGREDGGQKEFWRMDERETTKENRHRPPPPLGSAREL